MVGGAEMKKAGAALAAAACVLAVASCVEVTTVRRDEPVHAAPEPGRVTGGESKVHVYAWNPFDDILDVLGVIAYPFKSVVKGIGKAF